MFERLHERISGTLLVLVVAACGPAAEAPQGDARLETPAEVHLTDVRQLTRGVGENAEAYWSPDDTWLVFQSKRAPWKCDQIFRMRADGSGEPILVSTGKGVTTCSYFLMGEEAAGRILYSSTHLDDEACPAPPDRSQGYVWPLYEGFDIFTANPDGSDLVRLTDTPGYDAEATVCPVDGSIIFTSVRDGDLELYRMNEDGSDVVRLTDSPGYDGGAFFSPDCSKIVWRASRPKGDALADYRRLLAQGLVRPSQLEIFVADADGSNARQITYLGAASFGPSFFPSGERILFSSNYGDPRGREFELWAVDVDGTDLERITYSEEFDGFPLFSNDGTRLAFGSNRNQEEPGQTDVYVARWVDGGPAGEGLQPSAADRYLADVAWLADDAREGRGIGTAGLDAAADWLAARFEALGLPVSKQPFDAVVSVERGDETGLQIDGESVDPQTWVPASASLEGTAEGVTVYAGYGITSGELEIDDYAGVDANDKIVVVRRFTPGGAAFENGDAERRYSDIHYKARNAREHGAVALLVVDLGEEEQVPLPRLRVTRYGDAGLPVLFLDRALGERLREGEHRVALRVAFERASKPAYNVIARLEAGAPDRLPGAVVIGAHYDHLGMGGDNSLAAASGEPGNAEPAVHNGADDNASGTAALLEAARLLTDQRNALRRDVWFVAFSGEETGLVGSSVFVKGPPDGLVIEDVVAMLNMDMVGRLRDNRLTVLGGESATEWDDLLKAACEEARVECNGTGDGYGPSDQTPFYAAGVPVLHFFTGAHSDYHKPSDDTAEINAAGGARVAQVVAHVASSAAGRAERLTLRTAPPREPEGDVRSYGASLGTIPDYTAIGDGKPGVLLSGVRTGGAAETAGIRRGDRIVRLGDHPVDNIHDMMFALRQAKPGDTAVVTVVRGGAELELEVTYGHSRRR